MQSRTDVLTPLTRSGQRLRIPMASIEVLAGTLDRRGPGVWAVVRVNGQLAKVTGRACDLPNCWCDAEITPLPDTPAALTQATLDAAHSGRA